MKRYPAPAKLNLFLHVVGRRADGYHLLQSIFRLVDLCDWIAIEVREDGRLVRANEVPGVPPEQDLAMRAAALLQAHSGTRLGATIAVEKNIPMGGGLGGGSSDAATTLMALNALWGLDLGTEALAALAVRLGADVPFFLYGGNAWVEGVGERITPIVLPPAWYVIVAPGVHVPTAAVFAAPELTRDSAPIKIADFFTGLGRNDLEPVVMRRYPQVAQALEWLKAFGDARMSGSGSSVFAAFENESEARRVLEQVPRKWKGFLVRGLDRHPFLEASSPEQLGSRQAG
ncbi:MAG: 4-(cytidine 5'-diphospho)-2-C-methyl-D-erythritol kinase [Pseudomonadota bacterium]|nr:MAG: 4-(cytidine 5'-diphospho)-2-C-methyl-D-erythritol kinase [Pseudomonadota bacterium]